ncbi:MAG TPA: hypothetical protein VFK10_06815 [Burkholderiaceae bacterium]|nr:hypothetical protein [Burkholderiaceae bacterium]
MRYTTPLRATAIVGAFVLNFAVAPQVRAADAAPQRVAMARTHTSDAVAGDKASMHAATTVERASSRTAKTQAQRKPEGRQVATVANDGSRFVYDSCGCSND